MYKNIIFVILQILFFTWLGIFYFSDENIKKINKSRSINFKDLHVVVTQIPTLENDTMNVIEYSPESSNAKDKKKYNKFFELLGKE